jgi:hypothetical protein
MQLRRPGGLGKQSRGKQLPDRYNLTDLQDIERMGGVGGCLVWLCCEMREVPDDKIPLRMHSETRSKAANAPFLSCCGRCE